MPVLKQIESLLNEEELALQDAVRRFMLQEVEPLSAEMERNGQPSRELFRKLGEMGFLGSFLPEEYGGGGASIATRAIISEETARVNAGLDISLFADIILFARALATYGTHDQKVKYLVPVLRGDCIGSMAITETKGGSNALGARTTARRAGDDYVINGTKTFITNAPIADFILVLTRTSGEERDVEGGTWFIVERGTQGLATGKPFDKLGMKSSPTSEVFLADVRVGPEQVLGEVGQGFHYMLRALDVERVLEGASTVGIAQACLDAAGRYALERGLRQADRAVPADPGKDRGHGVGHRDVAHHALPAAASGRSWREGYARGGYPEAVLIANGRASGLGRGADPWRLRLCRRKQGLPLLS